ncbi:hypothetical protein Y032_0042g590 [Ancylostoma ceylanicum]|uniref:Sulfur globule protein CV3 domain protein n=1 Tax=Ancylostoma ceylanicum TaxID=53326 RepID=A0A016UF09_9BILA|nr:hypothetical protein Y032_0042g590 [Ancylostoma ceylanicum]
MNSLYLVFAFLLAVSQLSHASYPYEGYYAGYPTFGYYGLADPYAYTVPFAYGAYPYGYPYALHSHYYHPRAALRNVAKSFHREDGHLSDTSMISPIAKAHRKI